MEDFTVTQQELEKHLEDKIASLKEQLLATEKALSIFKRAQLDIALDKFKASQKQEAIEVPQSVTLNDNDLINNAVSNTIQQSIEEIKWEQKDDLETIKGTSQTMALSQEEIDLTNSKPIPKQQVGELIKEPPTKSFDKVKLQVKKNIENNLISKQKVEELIKEAPQEDLTQTNLSPTSIHILTYKIKPLMTVDEFLADAKTIRLRSGFSAQKVARKFGISTSGLYFIEDGKTKGIKATVKSISSLYGITLSDLNERYGIKENGRYQLEHKLAYVKKDKVVEVDTNGNKVKKIYAKREPKQKPAVEDA